MNIYIYRKVTKIRNVIERVFAKIKKWKILKATQSIQYSPFKLHQIFEIVCSFHNAFGCSLYINEQDQLTDAKLMNERINIEIPNIYCTEAAISGWTTKPINYINTLDIIPEFDLKLLRSLCCGVYPLTLAIPYYQHANNVKYMIHKRFPNTVRCDGIVSRHTRNNNNPKQYKIYFKFKQEFLKTETYCTCAVGRRTVGLCGHTTAALYILYHRLNNKEIPKVNKRTNKTVTDLIDLLYWKEAWTAIGGSYSSDSDSDIMDLSNINHNYNNHNDNDNNNSNNRDVYNAHNSNKNNTNRKRKRRQIVCIDDDDNNSVQLRRSKRLRKR